MSVDHPTKRIYCGHCGHNFFVPVYCKNRFCEICSKRRRQRIQYQVSELVRIRITEKSRRLRMLTLTIPNYSDAREGCRVAQKSFRVLRQSKYWKARVRGGAYFIEITRPAGGFHCHLHILLDSDFMPQSQLVNLWSGCSPGHIVYISEIPPGAAVNYVTKYLTKAGDDGISTEELSEALRDFRLFQTFGDWHNTVSPLPKPLYYCPDCSRSHWIPEELLRKYDRTARVSHGHFR